jgi:hypothetical protein
MNAGSVIERPIIIDAFNAIGSDATSNDNQSQAN